MLQIARYAAFAALFITAIGHLHADLVAQSNHPPLTMLRKRVVASRGATLVASNPATRFTLSGIVGLTSLGFLRAEKSSALLGFWMPRYLITSVDPVDDVTAGSRSWIWPNPFVSELHISIVLPFSTSAHAHIYDMLGNHVIDLQRENSDSNEISFIWNGIDKYGNPIASGTYLVRVLVGTFSSVHESLYSTVITCKR